ncbi:MAG: hypothetical protein RJB66_400 [Pseudomonadota bacterium]|jgi:molybdopterin synthase catalytic subunit
MSEYGEVFCCIAEGPLDPEAIFQFTQQMQHGAQNYFFGAVREVNLGKTVMAVSYDAYAPLGEKILREIAREAQDHWGKDLRIYVQHRVGQLAVGEVSVGIGVSSLHRDESYMASRFIIEQIKIRAPIWKKEHYEDGETEWLKGHALCQHRHKEKTQEIKHSCAAHL